jgi:hypothetical protein
VREKNQRIIGRKSLKRWKNCQDKSRNAWARTWIEVAVYSEVRCRTNLWVGRHEG